MDGPLKVSKSQKPFFLKLHYPKKERNIRQMFRSFFLAKKMNDCPAVRMAQKDEIIWRRSQKKI